MKVKVISSRVVYQGRFTTVREELELPNGKISIHENVVHPGAVVILPILDDGRFLILKQYRHSVRSEILEFPAGTLEKDESPEECAKRELTEETGYQAKEWIDLGTIYPTPGFCSEKQYLFCARGLSYLKNDLDEDEILEVNSLSCSEVESGISNGLIEDAKSIAIFFRARLRGIMS